MGKNARKYLIKDVSPMQDGYVKLSLAVVPEKYRERLEYLDGKIKTREQALESLLKEALEKGEDITPEAYDGANKEARIFRKEYDGIIEILKASATKIYWAPKGNYDTGTILDKPPPGSMRMS